MAGLEQFGSLGLLRSVAVDPQHQGRQVATRMIDQLLDSARADALQEIYLITDTADQYFKRYDFQPVSRQEVPVAIQQTLQFNKLCPLSAIVMKRTINQVNP